MQNILHVVFSKSENFFRGLNFVAFIYFFQVVSINILRLFFELITFCVINNCNDRSLFSSLYLLGNISGEATRDKLFPIMCLAILHLRFNNKFSRSNFSRSMLSMMKVPSLVLFSMQNKFILSLVCVRAKISKLTF